MTYPLVVIGAGGFGRETLDVVAAMAQRGAGPEVLGVVDDSPSAENLAHLHARGVPYLGTVSDWLSPEYDLHRYVVAVGDPGTRRRIAERIEPAGRAAATLIHPRAVIGTMTHLDAGTVVCAGAVISTGVRSGAHVHINPGSIIGHDAHLGPYVSINPGAVISGTVTLAAEVLVGAGATILQNLSLGANAVVGAAACVVRNVPPATTVRGVPAT